jgi:hypothetical protein
MMMKISRMVLVVGATTGVAVSAHAAEVPCETNPDHWMCVLEDLGADVSTIVEDLEFLQAQQDALATDLGLVNTRLESVEEQLQNLPSGGGLPLLVDANGVLVGRFLPSSTIGSGSVVVFSHEGSDYELEAPNPWGGWRGYDVFFSEPDCVGEPYYGEFVEFPGDLDRVEDRLFRSTVHDAVGRVWTFAAYPVGSPDEVYAEPVVVQSRLYPDEEPWWNPVPVCTNDLSEWPEELTFFGHALVQIGSLAGLQPPFRLTEVNAPPAPGN